MLLTVGHGTLDQAALGAILSGAGVRRLVDVRRAPGSRRHPHVARAALEEWVPALGLAYQWEPRLGGWRKAGAGSPNTALRNDSFRGYADYMRTPPFWEALDAVLAGAERECSAVMCSEAVYWRCHRRLISDAVVLARRGAVSHIGHDGRVTPHRLTDGVRKDGGLLVYDGGAAPMWEAQDS
ncbi:MAG TPA: DUF488 domain-containing protein [Acidimicrobiales bacterium]|nr:DUF488 domain-containing protein [Acidimicrobiales bacterium]